MLHVREIIENYPKSVWVIFVAFLVSNNVLSVQNVELMLLSLCSLVLGSGST